MEREDVIRPSTAKSRTVYEQGFTRVLDRNPACLRLVSTSSPQFGRLELPVSINHPTRLTLSENLDPTYRKWFKREESHLSVLILAWSYIFSARWVELMPGAHLTYTEKHVEYDNKGDEQTQVMVDIGNVDDEAARWWAAVLSSGEGWQAYLTWEGAKFRSPWSTVLETRAKFTLACRKPLCHMSTTAASFTTAVHFLTEYCYLHNIVDQTLAALSSALFFPSLHTKKNPISLPKPNSHRRQRLKPAISEPTERKQLDSISKQIVPELDKLLTLSCNTRGLRTLLSSVFYEPGIPCNTVSFLWLGGIIMGTHKDVLQDGRFGLMLIDLHAASWCGVTQSFLQEPVSQPLITNGALLRSDECRLLYLTQAEQHSQCPVSPWMPFGTTALEDTEIDVRLHTQCTGHGLQYADWYWACRNGKLERHPAMNTPIRYDALNLEDESASENATRNIFGWLRIDGYPPRERGISNHEWMNIDESDDESPSLNESPRSHAAGTSKAAV
ncbi:hypothetical protein BDBG_03874 [Blastomyces gilchristii SLH14081]|uniref:Uncharacterized protein n=1 Tax=Blastomyces gilchristii (strain SLH14081) TaxID=559298 RepID=A0A179ULH0_BLAGS|nr:uncharacterized protein BDBG_03874 [Blastomyces gilchristii SLH14081]OAT07851.1 hypothetical protein BDBG_03874 [Blastomyces gilchristii SLH14081]